MTARFNALAALALCSAAPLALAQGDAAAAPPSERPGFNLSNRHTEDWSRFGGGS